MGRKESNQTKTSDFQPDHWRNSFNMNSLCIWKNSVDPDQLASDIASWTGSTLFSKEVCLFVPRSLQNFLSWVVQQSLNVKFRKMQVIPLQWLSGRVLDLRLVGLWFEPQQSHCDVSLCTTLYPQCLVVVTIQENVKTWLKNRWLGYKVSNQSNHFHIIINHFASESIFTILLPLCNNI